MRYSSPFPHLDLSPRQGSGGDCEPADPANTVTTRLNTLLNSSGPGFILRLCQREHYVIDAPILFAAARQEISTVGYPTNDDRATLVVNGPVELGKGHTTAVDGTCSDCDGIALRNIQASGINGTRAGALPTAGGANIEMGASNSDQIIEYVHSYDPRSWSCLHVQEGAFDCNNVTVQHNDIGPCGSDEFQQWADGISFSCKNGIVRDNQVRDATDGGIVIFGSPGTLVENNTISVENSTLLGGINMVDYDPWQGDYTGTIVRGNTILGGFSTETEDSSDTKGTNKDDAIVKIGVAVGPRTWFGERYGTNVSHGGTVVDNMFSGAFSYAIALSSAENFSVQGNALFGNTSFIGSRGPNCSTTDVVPTPAAFVYDTNSTNGLTIQPDFQLIDDGDALICVLPPDGGDFWPFGGNPSINASGPSPTATPAAQSTSSLSSGAKAGIAIGVILGSIAIAVLTWFIRKRAIARNDAKKREIAANFDSNAYVKDT